MLTTLLFLLRLREVCFAKLRFSLCYDLEKKVPVFGVLRDFFFFCRNITFYTEYLILNTICKTKGRKMMTHNSSLDKVTAETVAIMEMSRKRMQYLEESAKLGKERIQKELNDVQKELLTTNEQIKHFEQLENEAWLQLLQVSKGFANQEEKTINQAYDRAKEILLEFGALRERERQLNYRRNELENSLKDTNEHITAVLQRRHLASEIIHAQEEERRRVAREIHDGPAQSMANVILRAEVCERLLDLDHKAVRRELGEFKFLVHKSLQDVRRIIFDLRPMALDDLGLLPALNRYLETLRERYSITINMEIFTSGEQQRLSPSIEVAVYRVIQEALQNSIKHAEANYVKVYVDYDPQCLVVRIVDDGKGFPAEKYLQNPHIDSYGILGMKERVEILDGQLSINSQPGQGTEVMVILPLAY